ncbi:MAG TPA: hypothetical protein VK678_21890 [Bradyrhizobium sp.]|nr:hypothetical protein [Bradyrhizobium sp.]
MMIVIVTRDDLRDEFLMADDAFALSPISARATQPSEQDYDAIREAFMETARGRWFLGEYAKRNRNADTRMVLDAVARVEENLAAQRQAAPDNGLAEALVAIRSAVDEARAAASVAIDDLALEETLAPVRKGARVIREIAWRWREIGTDGRICDLIDSQADAIEAGCGQIASINPLAALSAAFDLIEKEIAAFGDGTAAFPPATEEAVPSSSSSPSPSDEMPASELETAQAAAATSNADTAISTQAMPDETAGAAHETAEAPAEAADAQTADAQAADAHDEAVLDMVALEMAAVDPFDIDDPSDTDNIEAAELPPADPVVVARQPEPPAAPAAAPSLQPSLQPSFQASPQASPQASREASPEPSPEPSLGATLIANGILRKPNVSGPDPLAPIRRLSQAEKIAFFS